MRPYPLLALLPLLASCATTPSPPVTRPVPDARITFFNSSFSDWKNEGSDAILIRTLDRHYYRATFMGPCPDLPFTQAIGFDTRGGPDLDKFSAIIVQGRRCQFQQLTEIPPVEGW